MLPLHIRAKLNVMQSDNYRERLLVVRKEIDKLDDQPELDDDPTIYDALEQEEKRIIKNWRAFRGKNGMPNEAVPKA